MNRILVVDDEVFFLREMESILNRLPDTQVAAALQNGAEARDYLLNHGDVDMVFADVRMPIMTGLELAEWIHEQRPRIQVVIISAYRDFEYSRQAMAYGVRNYLCKPLRQNEIIQMMEKLTREREEAVQKQLWNQDTHLVARFQEIYRQITDGERPGEDYFFGEYSIFYDTDAAAQRNITDQMLAIALFNVIRCFYSQLVVLQKPHREQLRYLVLAPDSALLPKPADIAERASKAIGLDIQVEKRKSGPMKEQRGGKDPIIEKVMRYVEEHLSEDFSRDDVAAAIHFTGSYFSKYFRQKTGITFHEYLQQERLQRVVQLLEQNCRVSDAARAAGFRNLKHFYKTFRKEMGCSPNEYIKRRETGHES